MTHKLPKKVVDMYQERLQSTKTLVQECEGGLCEKNRERLQSAAHKLAGTAAYFEDHELVEKSRALEGHLKTNNTSPEPTKTFLKSFYETLLKSRHLSHD